MNIGAKIRELRKRNKMSGEKLGELVGVSQRQISHYEVNRSQPNGEMLQKICNALGVSMAEFDDDQDKVNYPSDMLVRIGISEAEQFYKTDDEKAALERLKTMSPDEQRRRIWEEYNSLPPDQRKAIDLIIRSLASSQQ